MRKYTVLIVSLFFSFISFAQGGLGGPNSDHDLTGSLGARKINTAMPFLSIAPDARGSALGDVGAATTPDVFSSHWNPAKYSFAAQHASVGISYSPWLRKLINDMSVSYLSGYTKISAEEAVYFSMRYFDLGSMTFRDASNNIIKDHHPYEIAIGGGYSRKLSNNTSVGLGMKYLRSDIAGNVSINGGAAVTKPANGVGVDIFVYQTRELVIDGNKVDFAWGAGISDIGPKVTYTNSDNSNFIPTTLRLGASLKYDIDLYNSISWAFDVSKFMVPTPPVYLKTTANNGTDSIGTDGNRIIEYGKDPNRGLISGMFGSFFDAPGGFREEMQELIFGTGFEYWYANAFAARLGYHYQNPNKGSQQYIQAGIGILYQKFGLDLSYLISLKKNHPLQDTLRFSLFLAIDKKHKGKETSIAD